MTIGSGDGDQRRRKVLVLGATGVFGSRLVVGLLRTTASDVILAGRDPGRLLRAARDASGISADAARRTSTLAMDRRAPSVVDLRATGAFVAVDAAGPFQGADMRFARAVVAAGLHYVDLADARDFVAGFHALDAEAREAGVIALTGASSTPALSNAVLDVLTAGWSRVDSVEIAIFPGNRAPRGLSVMRSILGSVGAPVRVFVDGAWSRRPGWGMTIRRSIPGLGVRWLSLADTPDLDIVPERFAVRERALFRAGLELSPLHVGLLAASFAVRIGLLRSLAPFARPVRLLAVAFERYGTDRGGMSVEARGLDATGAPACGNWTLVAEAGDGPFVPSLPALAAIRAIAGGHIAQPGASACAGVLSLSAIEAEFVSHRISATTTIEGANASLYERALGEAFRRLPPPIRRMHSPIGANRAAGTASVEGATGIAGNVVARLLGFPRAAAAVAVTVEIAVVDEGEKWTRTFDGKPFSSVLSASVLLGHVVERFWPFSFDLELALDAEGVRGMAVKSWRLGRLPLPRALAPISNARETVDAKGRFHFDVEIRLPLGLGRVVRYRGWLVHDPSGVKGVAF